LAAKESGILDWRRNFYDWSTSSHSIWKVMLSTHLTEYNALRYNALHTCTQHWSIDWNRGAAACLEHLSSSQYAMPVCDVIMISTISRMVHAVAADVMIILYVRWWLWARLHCVWKLPNLSKRSFSELNTTVWKCKKIWITRCGERILSGIGEDPD